MNSYIYKICDAGIWRAAEQAGIFTGAEIDITDGYIHFSTAAQIASTLALHFAGKDNLLLIEVDTDRLDIRYEPARDGQLFPHLYDSLDMVHVRNIWTLTLDKDNLHILPELGI